MWRGSLLTVSNLLWAYTGNDKYAVPFTSSSNTSFPISRIYVSDYEIERVI
jgi:hypothetical protein